MSTRARLTSAERHALSVLDLVVPRHPLDIWRRDRVRAATLARLEAETGDRPPLVRMLQLKPPCWLKVPYTPFYVLTEAGAAAIGRKARR